MSAVVDEDTVLVLAGPGLPAGDRGLLRAYAAYARVIGERRVAARERADRVRLAEADRTRTALLAAVSHDLRSPPAAVKASVSSLRNDRVPWTDQDRAELLETAEEATDRLVALVSNLLDMSRIQTGVVHPIEAEIGLRRAVLRAIVDLPERRRIEVAIDEDVIVVADPGLLDRVIANICENALKYTPWTPPSVWTPARQDRRSSCASWTKGGESRSPSTSCSSLPSNAWVMSPGRTVWGSVWRSPGVSPRRCMARSRRRRHPVAG